MLIFMIADNEVKNEEKNEAENKNENSEKKNKNFYMQSKRFFLTYPRAPIGLTKEYIKDYLLTLLVYRYANKKTGKEEIGKSRIKALLIGEEKHKETEENDYERGHKHFHCYIELNEKFNVREADFFDIDNLHGQYEVVRYPFASINYIKKEGNYIGFGFPGVNNESKMLLEATDQDAQLMMMGKVKGMDKLRLRESILNKASTINYNNNVFLANEVIKFPFQKFFFPIYKKSGFFGGRPMALLLYGESESGKSSFAYRVAKEWKENVFVTNKFEKSFDTYQKESVILFDEISKEIFEESKSQNFLSTAITEMGTRTPAYCGGRILAWPIKIILTTNENALKWTFSEGLKSRILLINTKKDGTYTIYLHIDGILTDITCDFDVWISNRNNEMSREYEKKQLEEEKERKAEEFLQSKRNLIINTNLI